LSGSDLSTIEDVDGNGRFTNADLQALLTELKNGGGSISVPEPWSALLLTIGGVALAMLGAGGRKKRVVGRGDVI
jgi:hypothetical protein